MSTTVSVERSRFAVIGGAGFIGSHFVDRLLGSAATERVVVYDNFSSGRAWHLDSHGEDSRLDIVRADVHDLDELTRALHGAQVAIHLASNPDIARAATDPAIDFDEGTALTQCVSEAVRRAGVESLIYASGSGVYGDLGDRVVAEDHGPMLPISTYGASKLAGEALLCSYSYMFGLRAFAFRFGNVVGPRQTHGVGLDFLRRLRQDPTDLRILGDGTQRKPYIYVTDVIDAVLTALSRERSRYRVYNVAPSDTLSVKEIADLAATTLGLQPANVRHHFTGGDRGWKGDVPQVRLDCSRIRSLGWCPSFGSFGAMEAALKAMLLDARAGRL